MLAFGTRITTDLLADFFGEGRVPCRCQGDPAGHGGSGPVVADANGPVGCVQGRNTEFGISANIEEIQSAEQIDLLLERHLAKDCVDLLFGLGRVGLGSLPKRYCTNRQKKSTADKESAHCASW